MPHVNIRSFSPKLLGLMGVLSFATALMAGSAVYTTDPANTSQNKNLYNLKSEVYVRVDGLGPGDYFFEVTNPNGSVLLSTDDISCRQVSVDGSGNINTTLSVGCVLPGGAHSISNNVLQLIPFSDTPNNGGEYKVRVYNASISRTDNFKVKEKTDCVSGCTPQSAISGLKYYDSDHDGVLGALDSPLANWEIVVTVSGVPTSEFTDGAGTWSYVGPQGSVFRACEVIPAGTSWNQTGPQTGATAGTATADASKCWNGTFGASDSLGLNFGNAIKINGMKYYDSNANGTNNAETGIDGFRISTGFCLTAGCVNFNNSVSTVTTAGGGLWSLWSPYAPNGTNAFSSCEILPTGTWKQTGPLAPPPPVTNLGGTANSTAFKCWAGPLSATTGANSNLDFGNVCLGAGGGLTLGFWSNKNGQALETQADFAALTALSLRNGDGSNRDFTSATLATNKSDLNGWLLGSTAVNMANKLSAQLAAMQLNVLHPTGGKPTGGSIVFAGPLPAGCSANVNALGYISIGDLMSAANTQLTNNPVTTGSGVNRTCQEYLKTTLDDANNNKNFVQGPGACAVTYPLLP